jgi:type IV pilus assembly protein PilN
MIRINLLPFRAARKKENVRRQVSVFLLSLALVIIIAVIAHVWFNNRIAGLNERIESTKAQVAKYNKINEEIAEIKKKLAVLDKKIEVIKTLDMNRKAPVRLMDSMTQLLVANRMWFTRMDYKDAGIKLDGIALDNQTVADFMTRVQEFPDYQEVKLASIKQERFPNKDLNLKRFGVTFTKAAPKPDASSAKQKAKK